MTEKEMLKISVEEFSRVQDWMELAEKDSDVYKSLKKRYLDLKVILTSSGVILTDKKSHHFFSFFFKNTGKINLPVIE